MSSERKGTDFSELLRHGSASQEAFDADARHFQPRSDFRRKERPAERKTHSAPVAKVAIDERKEPTQKIVDPRTHDTNHVVLPVGVMLRLQEGMGITKADILLRADEEREKMSPRARIRYACARITEKAPIWVLISMVWRSGERELAVELADAQFREEAKSNKVKAACVAWADLLGLKVVQPLECGDFEKPAEIAYRLIDSARAKNPKRHEEMVSDFAALLTPVQAAFPVVVIEWTREVEEELPPMADEVMAAKKPSRKTRKKRARKDAAVVEATTPETPPPTVTEEDTGDADTVEGVPTPVVTLEPEPEPEPVAETPVVVAPEPEQKVEGSVLPTEAEIAAFAVALAKGAGVNWTKAPGKTQEHWLKRAREKLVAKPSAKTASRPKKPVAVKTFADLKATLGN